MVQVRLVAGNIVFVVEVDVIVAFINSWGAWNSGIDNAIKSVALDHYHWQARQQKNLQDGQIVVATGSVQSHRGAFDHVIFVVDDFGNQLSHLVHEALETALAKNYQLVALPTTRMGGNLGFSSERVRAALGQMKEGIEKFKSEHAGVEMKIFIVIPGDSLAFRMAQEFF